jgi:hypothetical protein
MEKLIHRLRKDHPELTFSSSTSLCWSPNNKEISYPAAADDSAFAGLLHEVGHARLGHAEYLKDMELLQKEVDAWQEALRLSETYGVTISRDHIEDCLDTYRDWVHKRSLCPSCHAAGLQQAETRYVCINCGHEWHVSASRFCRPYRRSK